MLDAPDLIDDYYLNLLHWGSNDYLAIALGQSVFLWNAKDNSSKSLVELEGDNQTYVSSIQWSDDSKYLAVGTSLNTIQIWDPNRQTMIREMQGHTNRVSSMSWMSSDCFSSGGRDSVIINHDIRARRGVTSYYVGHSQEVCGLAWSPDKSTLVRLLFPFSCSCY